MRWIFSVVALFVAATATTAQAGSLNQTNGAKQNAYELGDTPLTPEMWFYLEQQRRFDDPKMAIRRNAEIRATQRRQRIAAMKWFGLSNQRPRVNPTPWFGDYSPTWVAGLWEPYRWVGGRAGAIVTVIEPATARP
jgi:hypothetical protein